MTEEFKKNILNLYPEYSSVLGPYKRKDGRQHIVLNKTELSKNSKGKLKTISYPKAIIEEKLGYKLKETDTIDHIDQNFDNNDYSNLQVISRQDHVKLDVKRRKEIKDNCKYCREEIILTKGQLDKRSNGPFCSRSCSGKYGKEVQLGTRDKLSGKVYNIEYYTNKEIML